MSQANPYGSQAARAADLANREAKLALEKLMLEQRKAAFDARKKELDEREAALLIACEDDAILKACGGNRELAAKVRATHPPKWFFADFKSGNTDTQPVQY
ncbi:MAG: hypothetical protein ABTQ93_16510 [Candidatus Competibacter denitrificans]